MNGLEPNDFDICPLLSFWRCSDPISKENDKQTNKLGVSMKNSLHNLSLSSNVTLCDGILGCCVSTLFTPFVSMMCLCETRISLDKHCKRLSLFYSVFNCLRYFLK